MPDWIRVKDKTTKHEFTIDRANLTDAVTVIKKRAVGAGPLSPTPHVSLRKAKADESSTPAPASSEGETAGDSGTTQEKGSK